MTISNFMRYTILAICVGVLASCNSNPTQKICLQKIDSTTRPLKLDIETLVSNYKLYQGKYIETTGQFYQAFEEFAIYGSKPFFGERKGFWLESDMALPYDSLFFAEANGNRIRIKGIVDTSSKGHLSSYLATIQRIYCWERY
jgi:hypothetical protein